MDFESLQFNDEILPAMASESLFGLKSINHFLHFSSFRIYFIAIGAINQGFYFVFNNVILLNYQN